MHILSALQKSTLVHADEAAHALASGWSAVHHTEVSCQEIERIYTIRQTHLLSKCGPHAQQLVVAVGELLAGIRSYASKSGRWVEIRGDAEHHFALFLIDSDVVGCIRVVSKLDVTDDRWKSLWQGDS